MHDHNTAVKRLRMRALSLKEKFHNVENARVRKRFYCIFDKKITIDLVKYNFIIQAKSGRVNNNYKKTASNYTSGRFHQTLEKMLNKITRG